MDNKPLEEEAESFIKQQLLKYDFNVLKPTYDKYGADLLILDDIQKQYPKTLKVQSKGRSLSGNNSIKIPSKYVVDDFIVFLYTKDSEYNTYLFIYFEEEIKKWNLNSKNEYTLSLTSKNVKSKKFQEKVFNKNQAKELKKRLFRAEVKKYTSVIIDAIFLEQAIVKTLSIYREIYPDREIVRPNIMKVIKNIIVFYNRYNTKARIINCNIYSYMDKELELKINSNNSILLENNQECRVFAHDTEEFVCFEVMDYMERIVNTENIILVADDRAYEPILHELEDKNIDVILVQFSEGRGSNMLSGYRWGDIIYPIAQAIGLDQYEW